MTIMVCLSNLRRAEEFRRDLVKRLALFKFEVKISNAFVIYIPAFEIRIDIRKADADKIRGCRPDYFLTDSFEVDQYLEMQCSKQLVNYHEIISTIIEYCVRYLDDLSRLEDDKK